MLQFLKLEWTWPLKIKLSFGHAIASETVWNRSEKVDHVAYKYWCMSARFWNHQNDNKFGPVLVKLQALYTRKMYMDNGATHTNLS